MLSRFTRTARKLPCLYQASRSKNGWSNYRQSSKYRQAPFIGAFAAAAAGTVVVVTIVTSHDVLDHEGSDYLRLLKRTLNPKKAVASPQVDPQKVSESDRSKFKDKAEKILDKCLVKDIKRKEEIIKKMEKYLNDRESGKLSEITGDEKRLINDAIHGPIELTPLIFQIINTKEFHRLKNLRQQGATHYVYPGANHTRFEHSIGVYHIAGVFARSLKKQLEQDKDKADDKDKKLYEFSEEEILCAEIAGLCHDLGHGPMSHMFEDVMKESLESEVGHEKISVSMFERLLTNHEVLGEFVLSNLTHDSLELIEHMIRPPKDKKLLRDDGRRHFLYEIVANKDTGIDVDKWDYYQRDCHYLGILQDFEWKRTMLLGRIVMDKGEKKLHVGFRDKEIDNLYGMFRTRANMYRKACKHKTVKAVERMFIDAMVLVKDLPIVWAPGGDKGPGSFKSIKGAIESAIKDEAELDWYISMTDSIVDIIMSASCKDSDPCSKKQGLTEAKDLLTRIEQRDLYKRVARLRVPKYGPLMEYMKEKHVKYNDDEVRKAKKLKNHLPTRQAVIKRVYEHIMSQRKLQTFKEEDMLVEVISIKHPSEEEKNPLDKVFIFGKPKGPNCLPKVRGHEEEASMVMVPQAFVEYEVRVYDKRCKDKRSEENINPEVIQEAVEKAWKELRAPKKEDEAGYDVTSQDSQGSAAELEH